MGKIFLGWPKEKDQVKKVYGKIERKIKEFKNYGLKV